MFKLFNTKQKNKKKFVIILGAGRCGTSYVLEELNKIPGVNIFGENNNAIIKILQAISHLKYTLEQSYSCSKSSTINESDKYKNDKYIYVEWYNDAKKLKQLILSLEKDLDKYFAGDYELRGFKEIRFFIKENLLHFSYLEEKYEVYYIHLTRNIEDQSRSAFWSLQSNSYEKIKKINKNIEEILGHNPNYLQVDLATISQDIAPIRNFIGI